MKKPRKYTIGLQTILFDRGMTKIEKDIDGITFTASVPLPNVYHFATANEGDFYLLADGSKAPGTDADLAAEFASAEVSKRALKEA